MKKVILICLLLVSLSVHAQDIRILSGDLGLLRSQSTIKVQFDYDRIAIEKGTTVQDFVGKKKEFLNKKEAGRGDKWERLWNEYFKDHGEPAFKELLTKYSKIATNAETAQYTMIVKAMRYEDKALLTPPNEEQDVVKRAPFMDCEITIVETQNPDKVLTKIAMANVIGRDVTLGGGGFGTVGTASNYDVRVRLSYCYAKAGKELGIFIGGK